MNDYKWITAVIARISGCHVPHGAVALFYMPFFRVSSVFKGLLVNVILVKLGFG